MTHNFLAFRHQNDQNYSQTVKNHCIYYNLSEMNNLDTLREMHPVFHYQKSAISWQGNNLELAFDYLIEPDLKFKHTLTFLNLPESARLIPESALKNYASHLGLVEMFNYWKLTASPEIRNHVVNLGEKEKKFWLDLLIGGMGEYFYVNQIDFTQEGFVKITDGEIGEKISPAPGEKTPDLLETKILIPIGGGKDSVVTLEVLKNNLPEENLGVLLINPTVAGQDIARLSGLKAVEVRRTLDPKLSELNARGFLNGHVPISGVFAFVSVLSAKLHGFTDVAISNERSSNEGNVEYLGRIINHQYSKSYAFEQAFREYQHKFNFANYFSFLRPLYELQIAQRFAKMSEYHSVFRSCNRGQKTNSWCGECPKCLFAFMLLYPFVPEENLVEYFGENLFEKESLYQLLLALLGKDKNKPFECVGTYEENLATLHLGVERARAQRADLPALLAKAIQEILQNEPDMEARAQKILNDWNENNNLPSIWEDWLKGSSTKGSGTT